jgi:gamma-polyglutamate biosynthesis protein CapA
MKKIYPIGFIIVALFAVFFYSEKREAKILFVGDMVFDRYIRQVGNSKGENFVFSCIDSFLKDSDVVVGNLEGPITNNPSISQGTKPESPENFVFTFPPSTAKLLAKNNIKIVNLSNNHMNNFGTEGITSTKKYLEKAGVNYFGDNIYRTELGDQKISFISYNEFGGDSISKVAQKIAEEKKNSQIVFVYAHWGDEYSGVPMRVKNAANLFAQSGADLIIGSHPHIILPSEKIGDTAVYYSLGNFIFDQYWDENVSTGLVLEVDIKDGKIEILEHRVSLNRDGRTCLVK